MITALLIIIIAFQVFQFLILKATKENTEGIAARLDEWFKCFKAAQGE